MMTWLWSGHGGALRPIRPCHRTIGRGIRGGRSPGASSAVELSLTMAGVLCLWSGVMEIMNVCGISGGLARLFRRCCGVCCPRPAGTARPWRRSPPTSRPIFWDSATPQRLWASRRPAAWQGAATASPATSCVCWWYSTPPPSSCCQPPSPPSGRPPDAQTPL